MENQSNPLPGRDGDLDRLLEHARQVLGASEIQSVPEALREALERLNPKRDSAREGCLRAYMYCGDRGANTEFLDNLLAAAEGRELPHAEWPVNDGLWDWAECGHHARNGCAECLDQVRARIPESSTRPRAYRPTSGGPEFRRYEYYILGRVTPVRLAFDNLDQVRGAQIPDRDNPGRFLWSMVHLTRVEESEEVEQVDLETFEQYVAQYIAKDRRLRATNAERPSGDA